MHTCAYISLYLLTTSTVVHTVICIVTLACMGKQCSATFVHDVTDTDCLAQNGSVYGHVFVTFNQNKNK